MKADHIDWAYTSRRQIKLGHRLGLFQQKADQAWTWVQSIMNKEAYGHSLAMYDQKTDQAWTSKEYFAQVCFRFVDHLLTIISLYEIMLNQQRSHQHKVMGWAEDRSAYGHGLRRCKASKANKNGVRR